jgi:hypothetical protein
LAAAAGVAIDNARLYDEAQRRQHWMEATSELTRGLLSGGDPNDVLGVMVDRVRTMAAADLVQWVDSSRILRTSGSRTRRKTPLRRAELLGSNSRRRFAGSRRGPR